MRIVEAAHLHHRAQVGGGMYELAIADVHAGVGLHEVKLAPIVFCRQGPLPATRSRVGREGAERARPPQHRVDLEFCAYCSHVNILLTLESGSYRHPNRQTWWQFDGER